MDIVDYKRDDRTTIWLTKDNETSRLMEGLPASKVLVDNFDGFDELGDPYLVTALSNWYYFEQLPEDFQAKLILLGFKVTETTQVKIRLGEVNHASTRL